MGANTANDWFYKPAYSEYGEDNLTLFNAGLDSIDARLAKEVWVGDPRFADAADSTNMEKLSNAVSQLTALTRLRLPAGAYILTESFDSGSYAIIQQEPGAIITIPAGYQLTIKHDGVHGLWQRFDDQTSGLDGVIYQSWETDKIAPEWWGAKADNSTTSTVGCQAAINAAINGYCKNVKLRTGTYLVAGLTAANTSISIIGDGKYRTRLSPISDDYTLTISGPGFTLQDFGIFSDRSEVRRGIRIYHASVVTKWPVLENLHFESLKGSALLIDSPNVYEFNISGITAPMCGDNVVNGTNDEAVIEILGSASSDQNNITIDKAFINSFHGPAVRARNASEPAGGITPGFRMLRLIDNMFHAGTSYADLTQQPCNSVDLQGFSDVIIKGNSFPLAHADYNAISVNKGSAASQKSQRVWIENNRLNGPVSVANCDEVRVLPNDWLFPGGGTYDEHLVIDSSCQFVKVEKQRVATGLSFYVDDRGVPTILPDAGSTVTKYWYQAIDGISFLAAAGKGTGINTCKNVGGVGTITNPATTVAVTFDTEEDDANYNVLLVPNYDTYAWFTSKATTGFTINVKATHGSTGYVSWFVYR